MNFIWLSIVTLILIPEPISIHPSWGEPNSSRICSFSFSFNWYSSLDGYPPLPLTLDLPKVRLGDGIKILCGNDICGGDICDGDIVVEVVTGVGENEGVGVVADVVVTGVIIGSGVLGIKTYGSPAEETRDGGDPENDGENDFCNEETVGRDASGVLTLGVLILGVLDPEDKFVLSNSLTISCEGVIVFFFFTASDICSIIYNSKD